MVIKDLQTLLRELDYIYDAHGNAEVIIMRDGERYPETEINYADETVYIEAYKEGE